MGKPTGNLYLPSTFEERGAIAPFTTPALSMSRVRPDDRHGLVLIMPNLAGGEGTYVVPWASVPEIVSLSIHDRELHKAVQADHAVTPDAMRLAGLRIARAGLAGPLAVEAAERYLEREEAQYVETHFLAILKLLNALDLDSSGLFIARTDSDEWRDLVRSLLGLAAERLDAPSGVVYERLAEVARILTPIGLKSAKQIGRLRRLMLGLMELRSDVRRWSEHDRSDSAQYAGFAADVADLTVRIAAGTFEELDRSMSDIALVVGGSRNNRTQKAPPVRGWSSEIEIATKAAARISWLLDGWDYILAMWAKVEHAEPGLQRETIGRIKLVLPMIPRDEVRDTDQIPGFRPVSSQRRVKSLHDWRTGEIDNELVIRLETMRTKSGSRQTSNASKDRRGRELAPILDGERERAPDAVADAGSRPIDPLERLSRIGMPRKLMAPQGQGDGSPLGEGHQLHDVETLADTEALVVAALTRSPAVEEGDDATGLLPGASQDLIAS